MKKRSAFFLSLCLMAQLAGCYGGSFKILYTIYPAGYVIDRISGGSLQSESLSQPSVSIQKAAIRADYEQALSDARVLFYVGTLEPYINLHVSTIYSSNVETVDLAATNAIYSFGRYTETKNKDGGTEWQVGAYYEGTVFETIDTDTRDYYIWMNPVTMISLARDVTEWLIANGMVEEETGQTRFEELYDELIELDAAYEALASRLRKENREISFVCMTPAFGCWQKAYGFKIYPLVLSKYGVLPNERQLQLIEATIRKAGVKYIVYEPDMTDDMIELYERVKDDLNLTGVTMSSLSSLSTEQEEGGVDYISAMEENLTVLTAMAQD